jgi:hypothetical protein
MQRPAHVVRLVQCLEQRLTAFQMRQRVGVALHIIQGIGGHQMRECQLKLVVFRACDRQRLLNTRECFLIVFLMPPMQKSPPAREQPTAQRRVSHGLVKTLLE